MLTSLSLSLFLFLLPLSLNSLPNTQYQYPENKRKPKKLYITSRRHREFGIWLSSKVASMALDVPDLGYEA